MLEICSALLETAMLRQVQEYFCWISMRVGFGAPTKNERYWKAFFSLVIKRHFLITGQESDPLSFALLSTISFFKHQRTSQLSTLISRSTRRCRTLFGAEDLSFPKACRGISRYCVKAECYSQKTPHPRSCHFSRSRVCV